MEFDPFFITSYLYRNFMIPPDKVNYSTNLKKDLNLSRLDILDLLLYLEIIFEVKFPKRKSADQYEYTLDIIFYIVIYQYENQ